MSLIFCPHCQGCRVAILRDMLSTRKCLSCNHTWLPDMDMTIAEPEEKGITIEQAMEVTIKLYRELNEENKALKSLIKEGCEILLDANTVQFTHDEKNKPIILWKQWVEKSNKLIGVKCTWKK